MVQRARELPDEPSGAVSAGPAAHRHPYSNHNHNPNRVNAWFLRKTDVECVWQRHRHWKHHGIQLVNPLMCLVMLRQI